MDGTGGLCAKQNKPSRERQILYGVTCAWNLKEKKILELTQKESRVVVARGWKCGKWGDVSEMAQTSVTGGVSSEDTASCLVNNTVLDT